MQKILLAAVSLMVLIAGGVYLYTQKSAPTIPDNGTGGVVCTMEAKLCPDGVTYVGRQGPNCEFAACPTATSTTSTSTVTLEAKIGKTIVAHDFSITPLSVVQDSRCPSDVQCIQAGTVQVKASLSGGLGQYNATLELNKPFSNEEVSITLVSVTPGKISTRQISPAEYVFTFTITKK